MFFKRVCEISIFQTQILQMMHSTFASKTLNNPPCEGGQGDVPLALPLARECPLFYPILWNIPLPPCEGGLRWYFTCESYLRYLQNPCLKIKNTPIENSYLYLIPVSNRQHNTRAYPTGRYPGGTIPALWNG